MRLRLVAVAVAMVMAMAMLGACATGNGKIRSPAAQESAATSPAVPTTAPPPRLERALPYVPPTGEIEPEVKRAAATTLQALYSYEAPDGTAERARQRLVGLPALPDIATKAEPLFDGEGSAQADIVYPQLGGLTATKASVMTVIRLRTNDGADVKTVTRTMDVRLERRANVWTVVDLASLGGDPVPRPAAVSAAAARVLDHRAIDLPDTARWDIHAGRIADRVLDTLAAIADERPVSVTVLSTGHPIEVFESKNTSNHIPGRGVDLWKIGDLVIDQRDPNGPLRPLIDRLLAEGVTELGAPFDVDGPKGANFANTVHQDHLHVAFDRL